MRATSVNPSHAIAFIVALALVLSVAPCAANTVTISGARFSETISVFELMGTTITAGGTTGVNDVTDPPISIGLSVPTASGRLTINRGPAIEDFLTTFSGDVNAMPGADGAINITTEINAFFRLINIIPPPVPVSQVPLNIVFGVVSSSSGSVEAPDAQVGFVGTTYTDADILVTVVDGNFNQDHSEQNLTSTCGLKGSNAFACQGAYPSGFVTLTVHPTVSDILDSFTLFNVFRVQSLQSNENLGSVHVGLVATADPIFQIDPSFPYAADYQLIFSPNLFGPAGPNPAPEPPTALLVALGVAGLLLAARQRKQFDASSVR
jgi:hypothetical protein